MASMWRVCGVMVKCMWHVFGGGRGYKASMWHDGDVYVICKMRSVECVAYVHIYIYILRGVPISSCQFMSMLCFQW